MKTKPKKSSQSVNQKGKRRGVALVTVLTIMSLATILIMTFFTLAQNEHSASTSYSQGLQAQQVAEQAVNMVIRQIRKATSNGGVSSGETLAWASQPGAIRTWNMQGNFEKAYKLYSDEEMEVDNEGQLVTGDFSEFSNWDAKPWIYVDLNEPVIRGQKVYYPIVDPIARDEPEWPQPLGDDRNGIEGFDYDVVGLSLGPMEKAVKDRGRQVLPMPAKWIYQLRDGSLGFLDDSQSFQSLQSSGSSPTKENPIVSRFAFWTDDETCKLNPNTHAGGASWATPMAGGDIDRNLGRFQPAQHEWQRYNGHPATTHLAPVLAPGITDITYQRDNMEMIFELVPRVVGGGSESGTRKVNPKDPKERNGLIADKDRLYASIDEFIMRPDRTPNLFPKAGSRGRAQETKYMQDHIEKSKFFLSVVSRAPEVTVFNTPRVSIWPTYYDEDPRFTAKHHTPFDRLIRFCAEIGSPNDGTDRYPYHFQRANADSATYDYENIPRNQQLFAYLEKLTRTSIPGNGGSFNDKYPEKERVQLLTEVFDYIRSTNLHDDTLFGFQWKDAFSNKNSDDHLTFTNGRRINKNERTVHKGHGQVTPIRINYKGNETKGLGRFYTIIETAVTVIACADGANGTGGGPPVDINPGTTEYRKGWTEDPQAQNDWSNFPPIPGVQPNDEATWPQWLKTLKMQRPDLLPIAFNPTRWNWQLAWLDPAYEAAMPAAKYQAGSNSELTRLKANEVCVQAAFVFNMFTPSLGWVPINPDMQIDIQIEDSMNFPSDNGPVYFGWKEGGGPDLSQSLSSSEPGKFAWASSRISRLGEDTGWTGGDRTYGGVKPAPYFMRTSRETSENLRHQQGRTSPIDRGWADDEPFRQYHYMTKPWKVYRESGRGLKMNGGVVRMNVWSAGNDGRTEQTASQAPPQLVQELEFDFPSFDVDPPSIVGGRNAYINEFGQLGHHKWRAGSFWSLSRDGCNPLKTPVSQYDIDGRQLGRLGRVWSLGGFFRGVQREGESEESDVMVGPGDVVQSVGVRHADGRLVATRYQIEVGDNIFTPHHDYGNDRFAHNFSSTPGDRASGASTDDQYNLVPHSLAKYHNRRRPYAMQSDTADDAQRYGDFDNGMGNSIDGPYLNKPDEGNLHSLFKRADQTAWGIGFWDLRRDYGDFPYFVRDYIHEAGTPAYFSPNRIISSPGMFGSLPVGTTMPWSDQDGQPWRTMLFRPNVTGSGSGGLYDTHPGAEEPKDHYFLDLFWMPVVEPYAISEPLSTGGKVNLNYQILPYTNIKRSTALRGVFKSEYMLCVPNQWADDYKIGVGRGRGYHWLRNPYGGTLQSKSLRTIILEDQTLEQFENRFNDYDIFRTASEICDIHLIPEELVKRMKVGGISGSIGTWTTPPEPEQMESGAYWADHAVVGDNGRERPYSNIYTRITTKSNTFKVHFRAQVVQQGNTPGRNFAKWNPDTDQMVAEYRGSTIVERYVEPNDPEIPDYATEIANDSGDTLSATTIDEYYKFRVVNPTRFAP